MNNEWQIGILIQYHEKRTKKAQIIQIEKTSNMNHILFPLFNSIVYQLKYTVCLQEI